MWNDSLLILNILWFFFQNKIGLFNYRPMLITCLVYSESHMEMIEPQEAGVLMNI